MSGLMVFIAVFLVVLVFNNLKNNLNLKPNQASINSPMERDTDWDNDGLLNREESYWNTDPNNPDTDGDGYLDGEEVASDHDPLIPAPNDNLYGINLTEKFSGLALAGSIEGSLKLDSPSFESSLNLLVDSIINDAERSFKNDIDESDLLVLGESRGEQETYINELSKIFEKFITEYFGQLDDLNNGLIEKFDGEETTNYYQTKSEQYKNIINNGLSVAVPANWLDRHIGFLKLMAEIEKINDSLAFSQEDPVRAAVGLSRLLNFVEIIPDVAETWVNKINKEGLDTRSTIFKNDN